MYKEEKIECDISCRKDNEIESIINQLYGKANEILHWSRINSSLIDKFKGSFPQDIKEKSADPIPNGYLEAFGQISVILSRAIDQFQYTSSELSGII